MIRRTAVAVAVVLLAVPAARAAIPMPEPLRDTSPIERMKSGTAQPNDGSNKEAIAKLAKWLAHRLVHPPYNGQPAPAKPNESLEFLFEDAERAFRPNKPRMTLEESEKYTAYGKELGEQMATQLMYVMGETVNKLEKVNAARMLALAGRLPCESLADVYLKLIREDKYPGEIKLYAFQGLRNLLAIADPRDPTQHFIKDVRKDDKKKDVAPVIINKLAEIYTELDKQITTPHPKVTLDEALVIQFIRREAVRAMAQFKMSVIRNHRKEVLGRPLWTLLRVARNDPGIMPGYDFHAMERVEALIGICSMRPDDKVNHEALAYLVNETLYEVADWHAVEKGLFQKDARNKPLISWKIVGARLTEAMTKWKENTTKAPAESKKLINDLADTAIKNMLSKFEADGVTAVPDNQPFATFRRDKKPAKPQILMDDDTTKFGL